MITSNECWIKDTCKRYNNPNKECECRKNDVYCPKLFRLDALYKNSLLTNFQRQRIVLRLDISRRDEASYKKLQSIEKNIESFVSSGKNLYIHSSICGNGKTAWSIRMIQAYFNSIWYKSDLKCKALFINVPRFLLTLKDSISNNSEYINFIKDNVFDADLVVWDEVGIKNLTTYEHENLLNLINTRLDEGKSNIYTSNLSPDELKDKIGERLYSRIINLSQDIEFFEGDKRGIIDNGSVTDIK